MGPDNRIYLLDLWDSQANLEGKPFLPKRLYVRAKLGQELQDGTSRLPPVNMQPTGAEKLPVKRWAKIYRLNQFNSISPCVGRCCTGPLYKPGMPQGLARWVGSKVGWSSAPRIWHASVSLSSRRSRQSVAEP